MAKKLGIIISIFLLLVGWFYYFQWRPTKIRKECYKYAYGTPNLGSTSEWQKATSYYYEACLKRNGLEH